MKHGFSLLETILATFILSLITMAVFNIFPSSVMAVKRGEMELEADSIAQQILEERRAIPFEDLTLGDSTMLDVVVAGTIFKSRVKVSNVPAPATEPNPPTNVDFLKSVRVTVEWVHSGKSHQMVREAWIVSVKD